MAFRGDEPVPNRQVREGMEVLGAEGELIGYVTSVRKRDFRVHRDPASDISLPYSLVAAIKGRTLTLNVTRNRIASEHWPGITGDKEER